MRYLSVCSGIEAASVAWHPLGWTPVGFSEIEPFPAAVLAHRFPGVPNFGDMTRYKEWPIEPGTVDLLVGGTPCQSFSVAGLRKGLADPRGNLMLVFLGIAEHLRPRYLVWENVVGVLSSGGGRDFGSFLGALGELGYGWAYRVLDAQWCRVDGYEKAVPQRRRRVFVVGCLGDAGQRRAASVLLERESVSRDPEPRGEAWEEAARDAGGGVDRGRLHATVGALCADTHPGCYSGQDAYTGRLIPQAVPYDLFQITVPVNRQNRAPGDPCHTLARDNAAHAAVVQPIPLNMQCAAKTGKVSPNGVGIGEPGDPAPTLNTADRHAVCAIQERAVSENPDAGPQGKGYSDTGEAFTLEARNKVQAVAFHPTQEPISSVDACHALGTGSKGGCASAAVAHRAIVRRLTPRECEILMGLPPDWTLIPWRGKPPEQCPDGPRYRACGNSMAANCMAWIGRRLDAVDKGTPLPC